MTAHVYNAIIIANDLNIMVSLNYSTRCLGRCGQTDCPSIHFQFTVVFFCDCTSCAIHRVAFLSTDCFIGTVGRTGKRSNRIRYTAQITMKIYELFSQCEFISWRALRANAREQIVPKIFILSFLSLYPSPRTRWIAPKPIESSTILWNPNGNYVCFVYIKSNDPANIHRKVKWMRRTNMWML